MNAREKDRHNAGCCCQQPVWVCETCSLLQDCHQDGSSSPICWKSLDLECMNSHLHIILASTFIGCHTCDGFPPTNSFSSLTIGHKHVCSISKKSVCEFINGTTFDPWNDWIADGSWALSLGGPYYSHYPRFQVCCVVVEYGFNTILMCVNWMI